VIVITNVVSAKETVTVTKTVRATWSVSNVEVMNLSPAAVETVGRAKIIAFTSPS
jgi:hypothetical protein